MTEITALLDAERERLVTVLEGLDDAQWEVKSLCGGWSVRDVAVHLLMPFELSVPQFVVKLAAARFDFDRAAARWARVDRRTPTEVIEGVRATAGRPFRVPGAPPEAPLNHIVCHVEDIYRPLGVAYRTSPRSADLTLEQLTNERARNALTKGLLDGLAFASTDTDWRFGAGAEVTGTASALITTITGRRAALDELAGPGAAELCARVNA